MSECEPNAGVGPAGRTVTPGAPTYSANSLLRVVDEQHAAIVEAAMDGFWLVDAQGTILAVNSAYCQMIGYTREEIIGRTIADFDELGSPEKVAAEVARLRSTGVRRFERRHRRKDGVLIDVEVSIGRSTLPGDREICYIRDISEQKRVRDALQASEERFRTLLQNATSVAVQGYAADGTIQYWNPASEALYGYSAEEALGRNLLDLIIPAELRPEVVRAVAESVASGRPIAPGELTLRRKDGSPIEVYSSHAVVRLPGRAPELFSIDIDLSERKRVEQALQRSEMMFSRVFEHSPVMLALSELADGRIIAINQKFVEVLGYARDEVIGRRSVEVGWVEAAVRAAVRDQLLARARLRDEELPLRCRDGRTLHTLYSGELIEIEGRTCILSAWQDITERRQVEDQLRLQSGALQAAANAILITERDGVIVWANAAAERSSGYRLDEIIGRRPQDLFRSGEHPPEFYAGLWRTITAGEVWTGEIVNRRKDRTRYVEETTITPMRDATGAITHFIAVKQDITQRRNLEHQFRQAQKMEAVGQLAGGIAHDFNNILAALLLYLGLLQDDANMDASVRRTLKELEQEAKRGAALTRQLLAFSRQHAMECRLVNVNDVVTALMKMLQRLLGEHIEVVTEPAPNLPEVEADAGMLEQVMINLCVNARDAMPGGGRLGLRTMAIDLSAVPAGARPGQYVCIVVADTGCGMDETTRQKIFEPFFTTKPVGQGTGLGLSTVYGIVRQHRGWVEVDSAPNAGATFRVFLPAADPVAKSERRDSEPPLLAGSGQVILVVEDDVSVRSLVVMALGRNGYQVVEATNAREALDRWRERAGRVDPLLTDMVMPGGMNGWQLATRLREEAPTLRVILCTGYSQELAGDTERFDCNTRLLRKPFGTTELLVEVYRALALVPGRGAPALDR